MNTVTPNSNHRIAKNTGLLFIRMLVSMCISLFTSRIVLQQLGELDFGVYNVVAGVVVIFSFITGTLSSSSSRFLSYEIGDNNSAIQKVFNTILFTIVLFCILAILLGESIGLWYVVNMMRYPTELSSTVLIIYQLSLLVMVLNMLSIPFSSILIAHERMGVYAYISIVDVVIKLAIAYALTLVTSKLEWYASLLVIQATLITTTYIIYCIRQRLISTISLSYDKRKFKEIISYSSWTFSGGISNVLSTQGINLLLNYYFGVILNTAYALTMQIQSAIRSLSLNFQVALNPQLVKSYASKDIARHQDLIFKSIKFSFFLVTLIALPIYFNLSTLLNIWLGEYPTQTILFTKWIIISLIIITASNPLGVSVEASGKIRSLTLSTSFILIGTLPTSWIIMKFFNYPTVPFIVYLIANFICLLLKLYYAKKTTHFKLSTIFIHSFVPIATVGMTSYIMCLLICNAIPENIYGTLLRVFLCLIIVSIIIFSIGLTASERRSILNLIAKHIIFK